jgi:GNAT superfamily N-acetyltransferase
MITTRFLLDTEYAQYADWLKARDRESLALYFGYAVTDENIDLLVQKIIKNSDDHYFLVAESAVGWVGTVHIAVVGDEVEFGLMVTKELRGQGLASRMMEEALLWARNRGYSELMMHCLTYNKPIQFLCRKHGLEVTNMYGESETKMKLPPPDFTTLTKEAAIRNKQAWSLMLRKTWPAIDMYG